jgi:hypothetical protein
MMGAVYYASPDGLVKISPSGSDIVTKDLMTKAQWQEFSPESIHAYMNERRYVAFYDSAVYGKGGFIIDFKKGAFVPHDIYVEAGYSSLEFDQLFIAQTNLIKQWDAGDKLSYTWKSKKFTYGLDVGFSAMRIDTEGDGVNCKVYRDGVNILNKLVTSRKMERLPAGKGKDWEIELTGTDDIFQFTMAGSVSELSGE